MNIEKPYIMDSSTMDVLRILLDIYPFHPILWQLYGVCRQFYSKKPRDFGRREIRVENAEDSILSESFKALQWLKGDLTGVKDLLLYDKVKPHYALLGLSVPDGEKEEESIEEDKPVIKPKVFYVIPAAWLHYVYARFEDGSWTLYLSAQKFCCRQVLVRGSVMIARRDNISMFSVYAQVDNLYVPFPDYFHIGVGPCGKEIHSVLADVGIFVNSLQLYNSVRLIARPYGFERGVIYALAQHDAQLMFTAGLVLSKYLKAIMKHLLVCRTCNMYVNKLVEMICNSLIKDSEILSEMDNVNADSTMPGGVPVYSYILDGDFPQMRRDAYRAPLKTLKTENKNVNICKSIIVPFFEKHCI
jgi:hypothetical protein